MMRVCSIDGCGGPVIAKSLCWMHYQRQRRSGDAHADEPSRGGRTAWLLAHVAWKDDAECLTWPFWRTASGYGPSRKMCTLAHGEPPSPIHQAAHSCGKGHEGCVNPLHLRWATPMENAADRVDHGRVVRGADAHNSKLTDDQVREIKRRLHLGGWGAGRKLAREFGVHEATICDIKKGRRWSHVPLAQQKRIA